MIANRFFMNFPRVFDDGCHGAIDKSSKFSTQKTSFFFNFIFFFFSFLFPKIYIFFNSQIFFLTDFSNYFVFFPSFSLYFIFVIFTFIVVYLFIYIAGHLFFSQCFGTSISTDPSNKRLKLPHFFSIYKTSYFSNL